MNDNVPKISKENQIKYSEYLHDDAVYCFSRVAKRIMKQNNANWLLKLGFLVDDVYYISKVIKSSNLHLTTTMQKPGIFASLRTFRKAFNELKNIRTMRCKGNFSTCDICTVAAELLRNKEKRFNRTKRTTILKWRRKHLQQQAFERSALDALRLKAALVDSLTQQPQIAFFMPSKTI